MTIRQRTFGTNVTTLQAAATPIPAARQTRPGDRGTARLRLGQGMFRNLDRLDNHILLGPIAR